MNSSKILTKFNLNGKPFKAKPVLHKSSLSEIRQILALELDIKFLFDDVPLNIEDEIDIILEQILVDKQVYLASQKEPQPPPKPEPPQPKEKTLTIEFIIDRLFYRKQCFPLRTPLSEIRQAIKWEQTNLFEQHDEYLISLDEKTPLEKIINKEFQVFLITIDFQKLMLKNSINMVQSLDEFLSYNDVERFRKIAKSFDKNQPMFLLGTGYCYDKRFHLQIPNEFIHVIRKHLLVFNDFTQICRDIGNCNGDIKIRQSLSRAIKYSIRGGNNVDLNLLTKILKNNDDQIINDEIYYALGYKIEKLQESLELNIIKDIQESISKSIQGEATNFLKNQIRNHQQSNNINSEEVCHRNKIIPTNLSRKGPQAVVSKTQQVIKNNRMNYESEESTIIIMSLLDALKNRNKKIKINNNSQNFPIDLDQDGSDNSFWDGTYSCVKNLYEQTLSNQNLKADDKDKYLVNKFIDGWKFFKFGLLGQLLIDRMIAATFLEICSRKTNRQNLSNKALEKIIRVCENLENTKSLIFGNQNDSCIAYSIHQSWKPNKNLNQIERNLITKILNIFDKYKDFHGYWKCKTSYNLNCFNSKKGEVIKEIIQQIDNEVNQVRIDAIKIIYHQGQFLTEEHKKKLEHCIDDPDKEFSSFALKIQATFADQGEINPRLFEQFLKRLEGNNDLDQSISYIVQQTKDMNRCEKLFSRGVILRISNLLKINVFNNETKMDCCVIINNCLEYQFQEGLTSECLKNCTDIIENSTASFELKAEVLKSILLTAGKKKILPEEVIEFLIKNFNSFDEKQSNFVLMILGDICQNIVIKDIDQLSAKLLDDNVVVFHADEYKFQERSSENILDSSISSIACGIFVCSLEKGVKILNRSLTHLAAALKSNDKQTRILSAKSLFTASKNRIFLNDTLVELQVFTNDIIPDVAVYVTVAYTQGLIGLMYQRKEISAKHIDFFPTIYAFEDLRLGDMSFMKQVNDNILSILLNQAGIQEFDQGVFEIFDHVLIMDKDNHQKVVEILEQQIKYNKYNKQIPTNTIMALESALFNPNVSALVLNILGNVISLGQTVSGKTLMMFCDDFYLSEIKDQDLRLQSFKLLDTASNNQDFADEIFDKLELQRASYVIQQSLNDKQSAFSYLNKQTDHGMKLPIDTLQALSNELDDKQVFKIISNTAINKQQIPSYLIDKLVEKFNPKQRNSELIAIFATIARNNQNISSQLLEKLEIALETKVNIDQILPIFALQLQQGKIIHDEIKNEILNQFLKTENLVLKLELSSVICLIISQANNIDQQLIQKSLIGGLSDKNQIIVKNNITGIKRLTNRPLDKEIIIAMLETITSENCDEYNQKEISLILESCKLSNNQASKLKLIKLNCDSNSSQQFLVGIAEISKYSDLLRQNFQRIRLVIDTVPDLQDKAVDVLLKCSNKKDISDELLNSIITLMDSTNNRTMIISCLELVSQIAQGGRVITNRAILVVAGVNEQDQEQVRNTLLIIGKNQILPDQAQLLLSIDDILSIHDDELIKNILDGLIKKVANGFKLTPNMNSILISSYSEQQRVKKYLNIQKYTYLFVSMFQQGQKMKYTQQRIIVKAIEDLIIQKTNEINIDILNVYAVIIQDKKYLNLKGVIDTLANLPEESGYSELNLSILSCIIRAFQANIINIISEKCMIVLWRCVESAEENIRSLSFKGLRVAADKGFRSDQFKSLCNKIPAKFKLIIEIQVQEDLNLLDIIISLKYVDFGKIIGIPKNQWARELLLSDLLARFDICDGEKLSFYMSWLVIERQFEQFKLDNILQLLCYNQSRNNITFFQLQDVVKFIRFVDFEIVHRILSNSTNHHEDLKQEWLRSIINNFFGISQITTHYVDQLVLSVNSQFTTNFIDKLLNSIAVGANPMELELLLDFVEANIKNNQIRLSDIQIKNATISDLRRSLEIKILVNMVQRQENPSKLINTLGNLLDKKWTFEQIKQLFSNCQALNTKEKSHQQKSLIHVLEILDQYKISSQYHNKILQVLINCRENWIKEVNQIALQNNYQAIGDNKGISQLIEELKNNNGHNSQLMQIINKDLQISFINVKNAMLSSQVNQEQNVPVVSKWTQQNISKWAKKVKDQNLLIYPVYNIEALAVIEQANFLKTGFHLTDSQILSCLVALNSDKQKGILLQVATGEGKSTIVSIMAIINALQGRQVDIITSSPVLAERDAKDKTKLYKMFGLSCGDNIDKRVYIQGAKECYKKDIVYGEASQFQFDILRDEYSKLGTLANRKFEFAIVDEVDSMLIDDSSKIARLSTTVAGLDQLQPIYFYLWQGLVQMQGKVVVIDNKVYSLFGKLSHRQGKLVLTHQNQEQNIEEIPDLKIYLDNTQDISKIGQLIEGDIEEFLKNHLQESLNKLIEKKQIKVPQNFIEFVNTQIPKWIDNAIMAFNYQENTHYIVDEGLIKPVDYSSTGIVQCSTNWSDGLHQFLQIKHALKMTSETFTTNFLSNIGYFKRYGSNVFGLTGTLGSNQAKHILSKVYKMDLVIIPSQRQKQYLELPTIIAANSNDWLGEIRDTAINEANKGRGTLIICESIEHTKLIEEKLKEKYRGGAIKLYTMNDMNQEKEIEKFNPGEIIIATNLAGRGTDIKTEDINENGGMHVIVTFMPANQRVEDQAFGRTARQGKRGTGQMILNAHNLTQYKEITPQQVKQQRDNFESILLQEFQNKELNIIEKKDELFRKFCLLLDEIRQKIREKRTDSIKSLAFKITPSVLEINILAAIEEQWAYFLRKIDDGSINIQEADNKYQIFNQQIQQDYVIDQVIKNPYYHIIIANDLLFNYSPLKSETYDLAKWNIEKAKNLDQKFCAAAFVGQAWWLLMGRKSLTGVITGGVQQQHNYKKQAILEFEKAIHLIVDEIASLQSMHIIVQPYSTGEQNDLSKQLIDKISILGSYQNSIQSAVSTIKKSQRLFNLTGIKENKKGETQLIGLEKNSIEEIFQKFDDHNFEIVFNDLTEMKDNGSRDQAVETINNILQKKIQSSRFFSSTILDNDNYKDIFIRFDENYADSLKRFLPDQNLDIEFTGLDIKQAQDKLDQIKSNTISLTALCSTNFETVQIIHSQNYIAAMSRIDRMNTDDQTIKFENLDKRRAKEIIQLCPNTSFNIQFIDVSFEESSEGLNGGKFNLIFTRLSLVTAAELIPIIRKENMTFGLGFKGLNTQQVKSIIEEASLKQEDIVISKVKPLDELFMNEYRPILELSEFAARGIEYLFEINEKQFIPWRSVITVLGLAAIQMTIGSVLIATGLGASVGMGILTEGGADIISAYRAYSTRQFDWKDYGQQKAISLAISIATMGLQALRNSGKGVKTLVGGVRNEVLEQAGQGVLTNQKVIRQTMIQTGKNLKCLGSKQILVGTVQVIGRRAINELADNLYNFAFEQFKPQISEYIQGNVQRKFCQQTLTRLLCKFYRLDSLSKSNTYQNKVKSIFFEIINPVKGYWQKQFFHVGLPLCQGLLSNPKSLTSKLSIGLIIIGTLEGMHQITTIIDNCHDRLIKQLLQIDKDELQMTQLLHKYCQIDHNDASGIVEIMKNQQFLSQESEVINHEIFNSKNIEINFGRNEKHKIKVIGFCESLCEKSDGIRKDLSEMMKFLSDKMTDETIRASEQHLAQPQISYGIGVRLIEQINLSNIIERNVPIKQRPAQANQIDLQAEQHNIVQNQNQKNQLNAQRPDERTIILDYANGVANNAAFGASDIIAYCLENDLDVQIVKVKLGYVMAKDFENNKISIIKIDGRYVLMRGDETEREIQSDNNNCGPAIIKVLLKDQGISKQIQDIRNEHAQSIRNNSNSDKALNAEQWVRNNHPKEANNILL